MNDDLALYKNIRARRLQLGFTQSELAKNLGYADKSAIAKIEKGMVDLPQSKIKAFADVLETTPAELMGLSPLLKTLPNEVDEEQKRIFATNLSHYLVLNGKTQREVADAIGVSPQTFNTWIQGIALPRMGKIQKLANYFGIEKSDLIDMKRCFMSEDQYKAIFSKNLKYYMYINGKTQIDLINDLGFNKSAVSTWCNGTRLPRMDKVEQLARYFGISRSDLIEDKSDDGRLKGGYTYSINNGELKYLIEIAQDCNENSMHRLLEYAKRLLDLQKMDEENRNND